jgi:hypothetical protein
MSRAKMSKNPRCEFCNRKALYLSTDGHTGWFWSFICGYCELPGTDYEYYVPLSDLLEEWNALDWKCHLKETKPFSGFRFLEAMNHYRKLHRLRAIRRDEQRKAS